MDSDLEVKINEGTDIISVHPTMKERQFHMLKENIRENLRKDYDKYSEKVSSIKVDDFKKYFDIGNAGGFSEPSNTSIVLFFIGIGTHNYHALTS